ncbi:hypothetical protein X797_007751 [Metarhizium robertsii]|uniref:Uncharacterized protein n=1 Tax=Metarhizium robertsii TaxID=568076 RepID=A0A0A1US11_9HYPO|nr:hypothetical protein X797_007751 [Metarhizium robertsii]
MCQLLISTTKYTGCPESCNTVERNVITAGCSKFAATNVRCANPTKNHMGQTRSRAQCDRHRDEGYGDRNNR